MIDTSVGRTAITFKTLELWSNENHRVDSADPGDLHGQFYMRFNVVDEPGVFGQIAGRLGHHGISIASVYQHGRETSKNNTVPVVVVTQRASETDASNAVRQIAELPTVTQDVERFRILS